MTIVVAMAAATFPACKGRDKTPVKLASPNDGPATEATYVEVSGKILPQYMTRSEWSVSASRGGTAARHSRSVVPLVDPSWKPGDPITMWVSGAAQHGNSTTWA